MKNFFIPLVIIGSLLLPTLGLVAMTDMSGQSHVNCPFQATGSVDCTQAQNLVDFMSAHVSAFSQFFLATLADGFAVFFNLFYLFALAVFVVFTKDLTLRAPVPVIIKIRSLGSFSSQNSIQFVDWLSLLENSPAFITRRP